MKFTRRGLFKLVLAVPFTALIPIPKKGIYPEFSRKFHTFYGGMAGGGKTDILYKGILLHPNWNISKGMWMGLDKGRYEISGKPFRIPLEYIEKR